MDDLLYRCGEMRIRNTKLSTALAVRLLKSAEESTSTASVAVLPEIKAAELEIRPDSWIKQRL